MLLIYRLTIQKCEVVVVNVYVSGTQSLILAAPPRQVSWFVGFFITITRVLLL